MLQELTQDNLADLIGDQPLAFVQYSAGWCGNCRIMKPKFKNDIDYIMNWWKPKAIRRYVKLYDDNRIKPEVLFYGDIVGKTWEETKEQYIGEVGR